MSAIVAVAGRAIKYPCFVRVLRVATIAAMSANAIVSSVVQRELEARGWDRKRLAAEVGHHPAWVTRRLNLERGWDCGDLDRVSGALGVPLPVLLMAPVSAVTSAYRWLRATVTRKYHMRVSRVWLVTLTLGSLLALGSAPAASATVGDHRHRPTYDRAHAIHATSTDAHRYVRCGNVYPRPEDLA